MSRSSLSKIYLVAYNLLQAVGWGACLVQVVAAAAEGGSYEQMYQRAEWTVSKHLPASSATAANALPYYYFALLAAGWVQCIAIVEILHAATGLVPSNPFFAFLQWLGKANALYRLAAAIPELQQLPTTPLMLVMWAIGEVIRYPWYALTDLGCCPHWLTWLRYSAFLLLYPTGVVCEMMLMYVGIPYLRDRQLFSTHLPNKWNFAWHHDIFLTIMLYLYPFLWWQLFSTLLRQRQKKLGGQRPAAAALKQE